MFVDEKVRGMDSVTVTNKGGSTVSFVVHCQFLVSSALHHTRMQSAYLRECRDGYVMVQSEA